MPRLEATDRRDRRERERDAPRPSPAGRLGAFLLGHGEPPEPELARAANLEPYLYVALPRDHPDRAGYHAAYLASVGRHLTIKAEVAPLLAAWREAGIQALLWKGFYHAEFVYPTPGTRFHGDVDVLLRPGDLRAAGRIAADLGWNGWPDPAEPPFAFHHYAYTLEGPRKGAVIDAQRFVVHRAFPLTGRQRRISRAVWARSIEREWEGTTVRLPHPVDAALICLLVHRAWGGERWGLKTHDLLDFRFLAEREGVSRPALEARAAELDCRRTLAAMLERCDPWAGRFEPGRPPPAVSWSLDLRTLSEHVPFPVERRLGLVIRAPNTLIDTIRALPLVLRIRRIARRVADPRQILAALDPPPPAGRSSSRRRRRLVRGIRWAVRLLRRHPTDPSVIRALAIYHGLRRQGWPVEFVHGQRHERGRTTSHAWIELRGATLPELREPNNRRIYTVDLRYAGGATPPGDETGAATSPER